MSVGAQAPGAAGVFTGGGGAHAPSSAGSGSAADASGAGGSNSAGANAALAPAAGGASSTPRAPDPNVKFDWQQTQPGTGSCEPGTYSGTFMCELVVEGFTAPGSGPILSGPIMLTLQRSQSGEFLEIADGQLDAVAAVWDIQAGITGKLDCNTNRLDAMTVDGVYGFGDSKSLPMGTVEGTMSGTLDRASSTLSGTWNINWVRVDGSGGTCNGPFTAMRMP